MGARHPRRRIVLAVPLLAVGLGVLAWATYRHDGGPIGSGAVTGETFTLVRAGMTGSEVTELLGKPVRRTRSLAEGLVWPEPEDTCWYYGSVDGRREYQICFVAGAVKTLGSYPIVPEGGP